MSGAGCGTSRGSGKLKFVVKPEPKKPKRLKKWREHDIGDFSTPRELLEFLHNLVMNGKSIDDIRLESGYEEDSSLEWEEEESDALYNKRLKEWEVKKKEYDLWYKDNKEKRESIAEEKKQAAIMIDEKKIAM